MPLGNSPLISAKLYGTDALAFSPRSTAVTRHDLGRAVSSKATCLGLLTAVLPRSPPHYAAAGE